MKMRKTVLHIFSALAGLCLLTAGLITPARAETVPLILPPESEPAEEEPTLAPGEIRYLPTATPEPAVTPEPTPAPKLPTLKPELARLLGTATPVPTPSPTPTPTPLPTPTPVPTPFGPRCNFDALECWLGDVIGLDQLCQWIDVEGDVSISYITEPDWTRTGLQGAAILLENERGERYVHTFTVQITEDAEPPVLRGVQKLNVYLDETIVYMDGVTVSDNADPEPVIKVDTGRVNTHEAGTYPVVYTASDRYGNVTEQSTEITIMEPQYTEEYVYELADKVLAKITKPGMTTTEKLKAIFDWGRKNVKYGLGVGHTDWRRAAVMGFTKGRGDCFGFYSTTRALLDRIGVPYVSMERLGGKSRHYWVLVNVGTGWYHFDTTIASSHKLKCFMWTDEQCKKKAYFWRYDHDICPVEVATEPFDYKAQVAYEKAQTEAAENE